MRVAHIITRMIVGGAQENTLYNCLDLIQSHGDTVVLMTGPTLGPEGRLLEQGRAGGLQVELIPSLRRPIHPWHDAQAYRQLVARLTEFRPDVVHTHSAKGGLIGRAAAWGLRIPRVIHSVHGAPFHPYQNFISRWFFVACERWAARRCHHMICVADAMTELMVRYRVAPREKFTTIYSGMDVEPFLQAHEHRVRMRRLLGFQDQDIVVGKIARLFHLKGHEYLIEAARLIKDTLPQVRFLLVGDGILRGALQRRINQAGMEDRFVLTGLIPPESIPSHLSAMDLLVHTSLREGLARTLPQALIAGIPVISYDVDGAREVVIPGQTGFLLPPQSVAPLAEALSQLARSESFRHRLGLAGRTLCVDRFRHQTMTDQIRRVYEGQTP